MEYQTASVMGVFRIIGILLLFYFGIKILGRILMPFIRKASGNPNTGGSQRRATYDSENRDEGEVRIEYTTSDKNKRKEKGHTEGEYVEFEELD